NCGGHAFATDGFLLGSILEEFKANKEELTQALFDLYSKAILEKTGKELRTAPSIVITVQGGIGTHEEDEFLLKNYPITSTGWGTPFLLVPEATTVDNDTLELLRASTDKDLELSRHSPLGVRFHYLKGTSSDLQRIKRIDHHNPGGACYEKHLVSNTEFSDEPICTASTEYQKKKIEQLKSLNLPEEEYQKQYTEVVEKECLCVGLSNAAAVKYDTTFIKKNHAVTVCPGPNIKYFDKVVSLQTMVDHIYGRTDILEGIERPNFLINELRLYIDYLKEQLIADILIASNPKQKKYFKEFYNNLLKGIEYYQHLDPNSFKHIQQFYTDLNKALTELYTLNNQFNIQES
ncbi:MAG: hypothetical protein HYZ42_10600, partial [Bacteroidetes bacterium]|nr:hypothetical protein [Bacteroidota bacterium]